MATKKTTKTVAQEVQVQEAAPVASVSVVVCAYPGTEELMQGLWDKFHKGGHLVLTVEKSAKTVDILAACLADNRVADTFTLLPPNIIPCAEVTDSVIGGRFAYVTHNNERLHDSRVPLQADKAALVELFAAADSLTISSEAFVQRMNGKHRLMDVSFGFGNFVTPVLRANPCEHVVIEAMVRKFFLATSPEGFEAIRGLLEKRLLDR